MQCPMSPIKTAKDGNGTHPPRFPDLTSSFPVPFPGNELESLLFKGENDTGFLFVSNSVSLRFPFPVYKGRTGNERLNKPCQAPVK